MKPDFLLNLAKHYGTPLYVYDEDRIRQNCRNYQSCFAKYYPQESRIAYAGKAFLVKAMARLIKEEGLWLDVSSLGELLTALSVNFQKDRIFYHGNCKTSDELKIVLRRKLHRIVVDNEDELVKLSSLARRMKTQAEILLRITPGVEAHTHDYVKTGHLDTKFGFHIDDNIAWHATAKALSLPHIKLRGFHCHIGSQIFDLEGFVVTIKLMLQFMNEVRKKTGKAFGELNLGGGLGIRYTSDQNPPTIEDYAKLISRSLQDEAKKYNYPLPVLIVEPGRSIVGEAGVSLYTIRYTKKIPGGKNYIIVDGGISDNPRPALYGARYEVFIPKRKRGSFLCTIAGKHCESDILFRDVILAHPQEGDILVVKSTGAYHHSMASNYNKYPRPAAIFASQGASRLVYKRETVSDLLRQDV